MRKPKPKTIHKDDWEGVDSPELSPGFIRDMRPAEEAAPAIVERYRKTRGAQKAPTKCQVTLRLDRDVLSHFQKDGPGWQTRINDALRIAINEKSPHHHRAKDES